MFTLFGIGFASPLLLLGLVALPILWVILRAVPPAPIRRAFPGVALLLGIEDKTNETQRTPWWLLVLRALSVAFLILAFAGPVLNPRTTDSSTAPVLVLMDASWAAAGNWTAQRDRAIAEIEDAGRNGRPVALARLTDQPPAGDEISFDSANNIRPIAEAVTPLPWRPNADEWASWAAGLSGEFDTVWISDGTQWGQQDLLVALEARGRTTVIQDDQNISAISDTEYAEGAIQITLARRNATLEQAVSVMAIGPDPAGIQRTLAQADGVFQSADTTAVLQMEVPPELRNRFQRFEITGQRHAGAVRLSDDTLKRREIAIFAGRDDREGLQLLSPTHYLRQALSPSADILEGALIDILPANPDVIILADVAALSPEETNAIEAWVNEGGLLVRFAGPRLANRSADLANEDPLMPVRLRVGGRSVGGAMSWGAPRALRPFAPGSPFVGLPIANDVTVTAQVLAEPDPDLPERTIAALDDGTPLVTRKELGRGQVVLFHVTANAEWSSLPLSGLFVQMLERMASTTRPQATDAAEFEGTVWRAETLIDAFGQTRNADDQTALAGEDLARGEASAKTPPGLYAGADRSVALNVLGPNQSLTSANWPDRVTPVGLQSSTPRMLAGILLLAGLAALLLDALASIWLSGRWPTARARTTATSALIVLACASSLSVHPAKAQDDLFALEATQQTVLAYVLTGNSTTDEISHAGLRGLSQTLFARTSIEPAEPIGVNLETDELAFFPMLYWPISSEQALPSDAAYTRLNRYLRGGGMILFDTKDAAFSGLGSATQNGQRLQTIALPLDVPPLEPIPQDHILTRTFYLLQDFPGRYLSSDVWVEAAPPAAEQADGMPFRNLNDNVTPVVIGGNDWAGAWAMDVSGNWMFPVGRGLSGERQREYALRFGVNLVMHVLTGNYKSDQVHVPALLDRLGQ